MLMKKRGFTLIELLVVIAIIAILAAILFPVFSRAREQARKSACLSNMKQIGLALAMYAQDWDETFPFWRPPCAGDANYPVGGLCWTEQLIPYIKNAGVFHCPSAIQESGWPVDCYPGGVGRPQNNLPRCNYGYNEVIMNGGVAWCWPGSHKLAALVSPTDTMVIADSWNAFLTPWARIEPEFIMVRTAFANYDTNSGTDISCGCPAHLTVPLDTALDRHARHSGGAVIVFADGHAKWYKGDQIKIKSWGGGTFLALPCELTQ